MAMASSLPLCVSAHHRLHCHRHCPQAIRQAALLTKSPLLPKLETLGSQHSLHLRLQARTRVRFSVSSSSYSSSVSGDDDAPPDIPSISETSNVSSWKPRWRVAIGVVVVAIGLTVSGVILRRNHLLSSSNASEASQLIADLSTSTASSSSQEASQFTVTWFGRRISLTEKSPGYMYFLLLMAAGFGLFVSEEALNVWVGGTLGRLLTWNQSQEALMSSVSENLPYITSTVLWVYWGVCISDMVPFFAGRQAAKSGTGNLICEKLGMSEEKFDQVRANVQRYGNLIGIVERFSLGVRNPTSFLAGFVGIKPTNFFAGVCIGGLITLPLQIGVGLVLRDRPVAAVAGVAAVVGIWTLLPYIAAGIGSIVYFIRRRKQSS